MPLRRREALGMKREGYLPAYRHDRAAIIAAHTIKPAAHRLSKRP